MPNAVKLERRRRRRRPPERAWCVMTPCVAGGTSVRSEPSALLLVGCRRRIVSLPVAGKETTLSLNDNRTKRFRNDYLFIIIVLAAAVFKRLQHFRFIHADLNWWSLDENIVYGITAGHLIRKLLLSLLSRADQR